MRESVDRKHRIGKRFVVELTEKLRKDGLFVLEELKDLNPEAFQKLFW